MHRLDITNCIYLVAFLHYCFAAAPDHTFCSHTYYSESFSQIESTTRDTVGNFSKPSMSLVLSNTPYTNIAHSTNVGTFNDNDILTISAPSFCQQIGQILATGDVNGDGYDDLICHRADGSFTVRVFENPNFGEKQEIPGFKCTLSTDVESVYGDFDGDGVVDILCIENNDYPTLTPHVYFGRSCERHEPQSVQGGMSPIRPSDILRSQMNLGRYSSNHLNHHKSLICKGTTIEVKGYYPCGSVPIAGAGDINGDGKDDIICINSGGDVYYSLATGNRAVIWSTRSSPITASTCQLSGNTVRVVNIDSTPKDEILCLPNAGGFIGVFYYDYQDELKSVPVSAPPCEEFCTSATSNVVFFAGDFNGDNTGDAMCRYTASSGNEITEIMYAETM